MVVREVCQQLSITAADVAEGALALKGKAGFDLLPHTSHGLGHGGHERFKPSVVQGVPPRSDVEITESIVVFG